MLLDLDHITKGFGNPADPNYRPVLKDLNMKVEEGERIAILGPSGSGKTTLLNLIGGLDYPDSGSLKFQGNEISRDTLLVKWTGTEISRSDLYFSFTTCCHSVPFLRMYLSPRL